MRILIIILLLIGSQIISAQEYKNSVGLRFGQNSGFAYKTFTEENVACEGLISFRNKGIQITAMIEKYYPVSFNAFNNLFMYYGYGLHVGYIKNYENQNFVNLFEEHDSKLKTYPIIGVDGIIGIEYRFFKFPFSAALEYKPFAEFFGSSFFSMKVFDFGLACKYTF